VNARENYSHSGGLRFESGRNGRGIFANDPRLLRSSGWKSVRAVFSPLVTAVL
jgi:hypothetical protein